MILYKQNRLHVTITDEQGNYVKSAKISVVGKQNKIAYGLIDEISNLPISTSSNGVAVLTANGLWGVGYSSIQECIEYEKNEYCKSSVYSPTNYDERLVITHPDYISHETNYNMLINCLVVNANCYSIKQANGKLKYNVSYSVSLTKH
jgi:hypothetical protein